MSFLNPLFLVGLAAAAIPVIIHLFTRRRPREQVFSSLEFLMEVNQSEIRRLRLKQWLLLLLRTLAVAAIAFAMARPAVKGAAAGQGASTLVVALVDRSGSMGAIGASGPIATRARRVVEDLLGTLGPSDEMLLVPYDHTPQPVTARPTGDLSRLRAAAEALTPGAATTDHAAALAFAARALAQSPALNRELFWISDFQAAGFNGAPALPAGPWREARAWLVPLAPRVRGNVALTDASLAPGEGGAALSVSAAAFAAAPGDRAVEARDMQGDASLGRGFVTVTGSGESSALLPLSRVPEQGGVAVLPDDALPLDNRRVFASGRSGLVRVVVREDGPPSPLQLALAAGAPESGLDVQASDPAGLAARLREADVLVVNDVPALSAPELQAALDFVRAGGGLLLVLGPRADAAAWNAGALRTLGAGMLGEAPAAGAGGAWRLTRAVAGHAVLAGFPARPGEPLSTARFTQIRAFTPAPGARTLLEFDHAHPALIEAGRTLVFAAGLDPATSDFPVSGAFLPLVHQTVKVLGRGTAAASLTPGERYRAPASTGSWRIEDAQGHDVPSELVASAGITRLQSAPLEKPGLYRVLEGSTLRATFAVNPDPRESDLTPASETAVLAAFPPGRAAIVRPGADLARRVREARYGRELWPWFVMLALALLVAESVLGRWGLPARAPVAAGVAKSA